VNRIKYWMWLVMVFGTACDRLWKIMQYFDDPVIAYEELCRGGHGIKLNNKELENISRISLEQCTDIMKFCEDRGIKITGFSSREYPQYLRHIYNPPAVLFYKGDITLLNRIPAITIVGTRRASSQSIAVAGNLSRELAESGFIIISGFAVGIDISVNISAANAGYTTVCVMGCGLDVNYPVENFKFREKILSNNGIFISEFFPGVDPLFSNFPKRNRILSGLSRAVVVVEAGVKSGALITAELALEQGREVFCVPPANIYDPRYAGNIKFLRDGACAVYGKEDITGYFGLFGETLSDDISNDSHFNENMNPELPSEKPHKKKKKEKSGITAPENEPSVKADEISGLSDIQREIIRVLMPDPVHIDVICDKLGRDISEISLELTVMEINGIIDALPGKIYKLK